VGWLDVPERVLMQKLLASLAGGDAPDLVNLGPVDAMRLAQSNALVSTDGLVAAADRKKYFPQFWNAISAGGKPYSIPWYITIRLLLYNRRIFREAGLDERTPPTSWEEIVAAARAIRKTGVYGLLPTVRLLDDWQLEGLPIVDASGRRALFATPAHAAAVDFYTRLMRDDLIPRETLTGDYPEAVRRYKVGTLGMLVTGPQFLLSMRSEAPDVYADTGLGPLAKGKAGLVPASCMHFVIPRASKDHAGASALGLFLTDAENQLAFCRLVPLLPSVTAAAKDPLFSGGRGEHPLEDEAMRIDAAQLPYARDLTLSLPSLSRLNLALNDAVEAAINGRAPALAMLEKAAARWDEILAQP